MRAPVSLSLIVLAACDSAFFEIYDGGVTDAGTDAGTIDTPCVDFRAQVYTLTASGGQAFFALPINASTVLVGTQNFDTAYYAVTKDGALALSARTSGLVPLSAARRGDTFYLSGEATNLRYGTFDTAAGFTLENALRPPEPLRFFDVSPNDAPFALYAIGEVRGEGSFHRFDGTSWRTIWQRTTPYVREDTDYGAVAYQSENDVFAVPRGSQCNQSSRCILHYEPAVDIVEEQPVSTAEPMTSIAIIPNVGPVAGNRAGELFRYDGAEWTVIEGVPFLENFHPARIVRVILPIDGGAIYFTDRRAIQYYPGFGYCPDPLPFGDAISILYDAAPIEGGYVLVGEPQDGEALSVIVLLR